MINVKAIGAGFVFVLASVSTAQEAPTHHGFGTVDSGAGTRRSGPDGAGSGGDGDQQQPGTAGGDYFGGPSGDGHNDGLDTGTDFSDLPDGGSNFAGAGDHHGEGGHNQDGFGGMGGGFFGGGAGGGSQGQTGTGPDSGSAPPLFKPFTIADIAGPPGGGDGSPPPTISYDPPPFGPNPQPPFGPNLPPPDGPPPPGTNLKSDAVPEPLTLSLFASGLAGAAALRRRRKKKT